MTLVVGDGILAITIQARVHSHAEEVLVVDSQYSRSNDRAPGNLKPLADRHGGNNTSGSHFYVKVGSLVQHKSEDILVVGDSCRALNNQLPIPHNRRLLVSEVGVLPANAIVNLVYADNVWHNYSLAVCSDSDSAEVGDVAQTIAAES
jgi:hypothetical protein